MAHPVTTRKTHHGGAMIRLARMLALLVLVATTIGCDRVTKHVASGTLPGTTGKSFLAGAIRLQYAENAGAFLSLGADLPPPVRTGVFTIGIGLILIATVVAAIKLHHVGRPLVGLSLVFAGGISNFFDRVTRGSVVDFMNVGIGPLRTGIFNVADMAVLVGIGILLFDAVGRVRSREPGHDRVG